jgi:hypothetical protein
MAMTREEHLLRQIPTLATLDEAQGFREQLKAQGEMTGAVYAGLLARMDVLAKMEGKR